MMTPERWQRVSEEMERALQLRSQERSAHLAQLAACDPELHREIESLLNAHERAGAEFLIAPALQSLSSPDKLRDEMLGRRLGSYQVIELLGEGGMGEVYRAFRADDQYHKQVALKVVRGGQDSGFVISRFRNERQILASLDHPNIARLLDGGTTDEGAPYFVMELIEGQSIDEYCNYHKLSTNDRLKLFLQVCSAVQYAHQRLIIHRDIKPGNILVTSDGTPKLLDFGIAKILDPEAATGQFEPTLTVFRVLTPRYASPEQIKGEPITTASDVYSLGVVLYELLSGRSPYRVTSRSTQELAHAICEFQPEKPSTAARRIVAEVAADHSSQGTTNIVTGDGSREKLTKRLRGDLDNIVLMALRKEPQRRYATVEQFAEDVRRHLENLPVIARKDTARYRASKFVTRHKTGVAVAMATALILLTALVVTLREARIARQQADIAREQRARAERRFNDVRKLANSLMFEVHDSIKDLPGSTAARKLLVTRALEYLDSLSREASGDPSLQRELAAAYDRVGDVLGDTSAANLGDFSGAAQSYAKALAIRESLAAIGDTSLDVQMELADEYFRTAAVLQNIGDFDGALKTLQRAGPFMQKIAVGQNDPKLQDRIAGLYWYTGTALEKRGDFASALQNYRIGASIREPIATGPQANLLPRAHLVADYYGIAKMSAETGHVDEAVALSAKALSIIKELSVANPTNATLREYLAEGYNISGDMLEQKGDLEEALGLDRRAHEIFKDLHSSDPNNQLAANNFAFSDLTVGEILVRQGEINKGLPYIREALVAFQATSAMKNLWNATGLSSAYSDLGMAYIALAERSAPRDEKIRNLREARSWYQKAMSIWGDKAKSGIIDALGHNQPVLINQQLAKCDAKLLELEPHPRVRNQ